MSKEETDWWSEELENPVRYMLTQLTSTSVVTQESPVGRDNATAVDPTMHLHPNQRENHAPNHPTKRPRTATPSQYDTPVPHINLDEKDVGKVFQAHVAEDEEPWS